ncbi:hypothetical protein I7I53_04047 [Histoplasma capsulatum var. duboisii H88]|uniref:Uncharacterized protein n=1 Tax=Ajellomyces capsulatus (strain H88) TaxID=544711 RepID=A0A8A1LV61_AJEC8|nr:hypothetical protein I7I53_04047 [Histoplasma capsulatum var. duboisii H88]
MDRISSLRSRALIENSNQVSNPRSKSMRHLSSSKTIFRFFRRSQKDISPPTVPFSPLQASLPVLEKTHRLDTEADVLRISILQFIHPVNIALQEILPASTKLVCGTESCGGPKSRFDVQWSLYSDKEELLEILSILEVKNTHIIHWEDFAPAEATEQNLEAQRSKAANRAPHFTLLKENAVWLSKQAGKYSGHCASVAVFDWTALFIFNYLHEKSTRGGPVRGTYFDESGPTKGMTFHRLLFAFVARALKRYEAVHMQS